MTHTHDPFDDPENRVRAAAAAREGAMAAYRHSPNGDTERILIAISKTLDYRLEQLWASLTDKRRAEVTSREIMLLARL